MNPLYIMDGQSYYQNLIQQGYQSQEAVHFTKQYYPDFVSPLDGVGMMAPPPPGSMELGGTIASGAMGGMAPVGSMATGGMVVGGGAAAAGAGAAAGGGISVTTIVVGVLVLGGAGTAGYFAYDYFTQPDFYGEIYWTEYGLGMSYEEDGVYVVYPQDDGSCEYLEVDDMDELNSVDWESRDGFCFGEYQLDDYDIEDKGDYFRLCVKNEGEKICQSLFALEKGLISKSNGYCDVMVKDIDAPDFNALTEEGWDAFEDWQSEWNDVRDEIKNDEDAPGSCQYFEDLMPNESGLILYIFDGWDSPGELSNATDDNLVHIEMEQGDDINWALIKINIVIDGGASITCAHGGNDEPCAILYSEDDNMWSVAEEITIVESGEDLCGSGGCEIEVQITKIGVGSEDDKILATVTVYASNNA